MQISVRPTLEIFMVVSLGFLSARAQTSNVICLDSYAWTYNSYGQSPCLVAAYLQQQCSNSATINISALRQNDLYIPPANQSDDSCQCNSVVYSLMSACASCQLRNYVSWSTWTSQCAVVYLNVFPKNTPSETAVPSWAYHLDLDQGVAFNITAAKMLATTSLTGSDGTTKGNHMSIAVSGIIGAAFALVVVACIGGIIFFWRRRRLRLSNPQTSKYSPLYEIHPTASSIVGAREVSMDYMQRRVAAGTPITIDVGPSLHMALDADGSRVSLPNDLYSLVEAVEFSPAKESSHACTTPGGHAIEPVATSPPQMPTRGATVP